LSPTKRSTAKSNRASNSLVALSSAAVFAVYSLGFVRTRSAAERFAVAESHRRTIDPVEVAAPVATASATDPHLPDSPRPMSPAGSTLPTPAATPALLSKSPESMRVATAVSAKDASRTAQPKLDASSPATTTSSVVSNTAAQTPAPTQIQTPTPTPTPAEPVPPAGSAGTPVVEPAAPSPPPAPVRRGFKDGTYLGWGSSRHGDIQASVVIEGGRIVSATIAQCLTRYSCSWIAPLPPQVVTIQRAGVDLVSGATESSYAFQDAVAEALSKAK
jgi:uncharacterized protein with FMN-binding domain